MQTVREHDDEVVVENGILAFEHIKSLAHLLSILDAESQVLLLECSQSAATSIWERTFVTVHLGWRVEPTAIIGQFEIHVVVKLVEGVSANIIEVLGEHVLLEMRQKSINCNKINSLGFATCYVTHSLEPSLQKVLELYTMLLVESAEDVVDEPLGINDDYAVDIGDQRCDKA